MRALITGINGFVGGHLAEHLLHLGETDIWGVGREDSLFFDQLHNRVRFLQADLCDQVQTIQAIADIRPDVIFHLAGQAAPSESFRTPAQTLHINIQAQLSVLLALIEHGLNPRVLIIGSGDEYGLIRPEDLPVNEQTPLRPTSPYGVSKIAQDMLALQYCVSHRLDLIRVRPFNHIGPRQNELFVASAFARQIARIEHGLQPPIIGVGNLEAQRDFTDVRDMVRAYVLAIQHGESGQVYNIGSGKGVSIRYMLDTLLAASETKIEIRPDPKRMRPIDIPAVICDATRFRTRTGWEPRIPFPQTLGDILHDWRTRVCLEQKRYLEKG